MHILNLVEMISRKWEMSLGMALAVVLEARRYAPA
jgi:hypothetical protein